MNLFDMQTKFRDRTSGLADSIALTDVNKILNRWYQFMVPSDVEGDYFEDVWQWQVVTTSDQYFAGDQYSNSDWPDYVVSLHTDGSPWITGYAEGGQTYQTQRHYLDVETRRSVWNVTDRQDPYQGSLPDARVLVTDRPTSVLIDRRRVALSPIPDRDYIIVFPGRMGPSIKLGPDSATESDGVADEVYAMCVICGAAAEYLTEKEDYAHAAVQQGDYEQYLERLQARSTLAEHRSPMRSYK